MGLYKLWDDEKNPHKLIKRIGFLQEYWKYPGYLRIGGYFCSNFRWPHVRLPSTHESSLLYRIEYRGYGISITMDYNVLFVFFEISGSSHSHTFFLRTDVENSYGCISPVRYLFEPLNKHCYPTIIFVPLRQPLLVF